MKRSRTAIRKPAARTHALRRRLEALEDRTVPNAVAPPDGLVSWWTADNTAADLKGLNNATLYNGTTYAAGKVQQAFSFDGLDDRAELGDPDSLKFTASMSIEGWILVRGYTPGTQEAILFRGDGHGLDPYQLTIWNDGKLTFKVTGTTGSASVAAPVPLGQLIHVAATLDDATGAMTLYENAAVVAQTVTTIRPVRDLDPAYNPGIGIGNSPSAYNIPLNGLIDELSVYNRALTAGEVQGIYSAGTAGKIKNSTTYIAADFPSVAEGAAGSTTPVTFTLRRVGNLSGQAVVNWATADGTATAGPDYVAASGQVVLQDGQSQTTVTVTVNGDNLPEANESFQLLVSTPTPGYAVGAGWATVIDDDVGVSVADSTATEGDGRIGQSLGAFVAQSDNGNMNRSAGMAWGPDGNLYVGSLNTNQVLRFDGATGAFLGVFIDGMDSPAGLVFRPDGKLYVLSRNAAEVQRFDAATGAFLDVFIPSGSGGLATANGMAVGPDGNWYVASTGTNQILRYSGATGAFLGVFVPAGSGGLNSPRFPAFGPDGNLYVSNSAGGSGNTVLRFNGTTGAFLNAFVAAGSGGLLFPAQMLFSGGSLYVSSQNTNEVLRYDAQSGAFLDKAATARLGGLDRPIGLLFDANGNLLVGSNAEVLRYGPRSQAAFTVSLSLPSATPVTVDYGTATAGSDFTPVSGTLTFAPGQTAQTVVVPTLNDATAEGTEMFTLSLSNASGALITRGQGTGTITDDDTTKFFVVDDAGTDRTYRYGVPGSALAASPLGSGNTAPRGVASYTASNTAGTTVWVADANKNVYVYDAAGGLLGGWTANGLPKNCTVEGIAVYGADVWIVANSTSKDKVFKYAGAAVLRSGSQTVTSSFGLTSADTNPKGVVTDGASLWVVDDGASADKVFKYTLTGSLLGSWAIDPANAHPTGLTINPNNVSDIWVVDSGTDRVYQYTAAATLISGSQAASATFALAAGDTNP
jgi:hypothetical protein